MPGTSDRRQLLVAGGRGLASLALLGSTSACGDGAPDPKLFSRVAQLNDVPSDAFARVKLPARVPGVAPFGIYLRRDAGRDNRVVALQSTCPHLGCPVRYTEAARRFICPCHGGVFDERGRPVSGPARRALMRRATAVHDGSVYVGPFATRADLRTFELLAERARRSRP